jgi:hypothetical protein
MMVNIEGIYLNIKKDFILFRLILNVLLSHFEYNVFGIHMTISKMMFVEFKDFILASIIFRSITNVNFDKNLSRFPGKSFGIIYSILHFQRIPEQLTIGRMNVTLDWRTKQYLCFFSIDGSIIIRKLYLKCNK